jgi:hypothetical protein
MNKKVETIIMIAGLSYLSIMLTRSINSYRQHKQMEDLRNQLKHEKMCNSNQFWWQEES